MMTERKTSAVMPDSVPLQSAQYSDLSDEVDVELFPYRFARLRVLALCLDFAKRSQ